jgi:hypothetical protein
MREALADRWEGERWRLWSFVAGAAAVPVALAVAFVITAVSGERFVPLALLLLVAVILAGSVVGSGVIDTLSSQMNRGGLARESTGDVDRALDVGGPVNDASGPTHQKDMRTIRAGLFVLAPIAAFVYFMTIV